MKKFLLFACLLTFACPAFGQTEALDEVNQARAARGLPPFEKDDGLTQAALSVSAYRAANLIEGHTNDFSFLPAGCSADAAGCAAWPAGLGWGSCCTYEGHTHAGAAFCVGKDGRRYMHIFVRGSCATGACGSARMTIHERPHMTRVRFIARRCR